MPFELVPFPGSGLVVPVYSVTEERRFQFLRAYPPAVSSLLFGAGGGGGGGGGGGALAAPASAAPGSDEALSVSARTGDAPAPVVASKAAVTVAKRAPTARVADDAADVATAAPVAKKTTKKTAGKKTAKG
jgi:hypothetical protein